MSKQLILSSLIVAFFVPRIGLGEAPPLERADTSLRYTERRIAVLPVQDWTGVDPTSLFFTEEASRDASSKNTHDFAKKLTSTLEQDPRFHGVGPDEIKRYFQSDPSHATAV